MAEKPQETRPFIDGIKNRRGVKCAGCKQVIVSFHRHDFHTCKCGLTFVDGGRDYLRYGTTEVGAVGKPKVVDV